MVRTATGEDIKPLAQLYKELMVYHNKLDPQKYTVPDDAACEAKMKDFVEDYLSMFRVICHETDGIIDGFVVFLILAMKSTKENPTGEIMVNNIFVAEDSRRKGIGTELLNKLYEVAEETFCSNVTIDVHLANDSAQKFYEKMGMIPTTIHMEKRI